MSFWDNVKKFAQPYADEEYDDYEEEADGFADEQQEPRASRRMPAFSSASEEAATEPATPTYSTPSYTARYR